MCEQAGVKILQSSLKRAKILFYVFLIDSLFEELFIMLDTNLLRKQLDDVVARLATRPFEFPVREFNALENRMLKSGIFWSFTAMTS